MNQLTVYVSSSRMLRTFEDNEAALDSKRALFNWQLNAYKPSEHFWAYLVNLFVVNPMIHRFPFQKLRFRKLLNRAEIRSLFDFKPMVESAAIYHQLSVIFDEDDNFLFDVCLHA